MKSILFTCLALLHSAALAQIQLSTSLVSFAGVELGEASPPQIVRVTNLGKEPAQVIVSNMCPMDFDLDNFCNLSLSPGMSCTLNVAFTPRQTGYQSCTILVNHTRQGDSRSLTASGNGVN